jgi:RNA polymerase sigma factor (sigma-70 family)
MSKGEEAWVRRASEGDHVALDALLERHLPGLRAFVRKNVGPEVLAKESSSDVVQSVCREVLGDLARLEYRGEAAFRALLQQAALRKLIDRQRYYRAEKRDVGRERDASATLSASELRALRSSMHSPSAAALEAEELARLEQAFARLSEPDRQLIRWVHIEGLPHSVVAERLATTESNTRKQLSRALARLSRILL